MDQNELPEGFRQAYSHFRMRLETRYQMDATADEWLALIQDVIEKRSVFVYAHKGREIHYVDLRATPVKVVWSPLGQLIVTALPKKQGTEKRSFGGKQKPRMRSPFSNSLKVTGKIRARKARK